ncbi:hypothetical protein B0H14DRAFT_3482374 [Mycena olivaceomarginata]|nr:hypothetical protein B0H14DRAFT_3482374 [Mycena olivaceomarginata]
MRISAAGKTVRDTTKDRTDMHTVSQCPEPRRCLFALCSHAHDPIVLKSTPAPTSSYVPPPSSPAPSSAGPSSPPAAPFSSVLPASPCSPRLLPCCTPPSSAPRTSLRTCAILTIHRPHAPGLWVAPDSPPASPARYATQLESFSLFGCWGDWRDLPPALAAAILRLVAGGGLERLHVLTVANVPAAFCAAPSRCGGCPCSTSALDPAEKVRKRKACPTQPQLVESEWSPEYLNLSLDSKVGKVLEYMAGSDSSSSSSRGNSSPKTKNTAHTSNYFLPRPPPRAKPDPEQPGQRAELRARAARGGGHVGEARGAVA